MPARITKASPGNKLSNYRNRKGTNHWFHIHVQTLMLSVIQKLKQKIVEQTNDTSKLDSVNQQLQNERQTVEKLQAKIQSMMGEMSNLRAETSQERLAKNANEQL